MAKPPRRPLHEPSARKFAENQQTHASDKACTRRFSWNHAWASEGFWWQRRTPSATWLLAHPSGPWPPTGKEKKNLYECRRCERVSPAEAGADVGICLTSSGHQPQSSTKRGEAVRWLLPSPKTSEIHTKPFCIWTSQHGRAREGLAETSGDSEAHIAHKKVQPGGASALFISSSPVLNIPPLTRTDVP